MKVPFSNTTRTGATIGVASPSRLRGSVSSRAFVAAGLSSGLDAIETAFDKLDQRQRQVDRFDATADYHAWQSQQDEKETVLRRESPLGDSEFVAKRTKMFDDDAENFLGSLKPELKAEFQVKLESKRRQTQANALKFQLESQDNKARTDIQAFADKASNGIGEDHTTMGRWERETEDLINTSALSRTEKDLLILQSKKRYATIAFRQSSKDILRALPRTPTEVIKLFEGIRLEPYADTRTSTGAFDKWRIGFGTDYVIRADGSREVVHPGMKISRADAERTLQHRLTTVDFPGIEKQLGSSLVGKLPQRAIAALASVHYNYGNLPQSVVKAAKSGNLSTLANAVGRLSANKNRRRQEAAIIRGETALDNDPRFAGLSFEEKAKLTRAAEVEVARDIAAEKAEENRRQNELVDSMLVDIRSGRLDRTGLDQAIERGDVEKFSDISRLDAAIARYQKETFDLAKAQEMYSSDAYAWGADTTNERKAHNLIHGAGGREAFNSLDGSYVTQQFLPNARRTGGVASDAINQLATMRHATDARQARYALDTLSQLQEAEPAIFNRQVSDDVRKDVAFYLQRRDQQSMEQILESINSRHTPEARTLREESSRIIRRDDEGTYEASSIATQLGVDQTPLLPFAATTLEKDYQVAFEDAFVLTRNETQARQLAAKNLQGVWGKTDIGSESNSFLGGLLTFEQQPFDLLDKGLFGEDTPDGPGSYLMRFPPQNAGYTPGTDGTYSWISEQVRASFPQIGNGAFQLVSDPHTEQMAREFKLDPNKQPPGYFVAYKDTDGVPKLLTREDGKPMRMSFTRTVEEEAASVEANKKRDADFKARLQERELNDIGPTYAYAIQMSQLTGLEIPTSIIEQKERYESKYGPLPFEQFVNLDGTIGQNLPGQF